MDKIRNRAIEHLPSVLLTLLSIIQALALESLWESTIHRPEFFDWSWMAFLGWLQAIVTLLVIVLIWLIYVALVMRFRWTPAFADLALPFVVGIGQLALIEFTAPSMLGPWCLALGILGATTMAIDYRFVRCARLDEQNKEFFDNVLPATWRDFAPQISFVIFAIGAGVIILATGHNGWFALATLLFALIAMVHITWIQTYFWNKSMGNQL